MYDNPLYDQVVAHLRAAADSPDDEDVRPKVNAALVLLVTMIGKEPAKKADHITRDLTHALQRQRPIYMNGAPVFVVDLQVDSREEIETLSLGGTIHQISGRQPRKFTATFLF